MNNENKIGLFIQERRKAKDWSKRTLAENAGVSHSEVHRIETGERQKPSVPVLYAIADALGVPKDEILRAAGYQTGDDDAPAIERAFPGLKNPKQQDTVQKIVDGLCRNSELNDADYDDLVRQVEMFLQYAKKRNT